MSSALSPQYPDHPHGHRSSSSRWMTTRLLTRTSRSVQPIDHECSPVDEAEEFHDPYSDLNLFLSQKIRTEMRKEGIIKKWSLKIQEILLDKVAPEFQKKFPHYRLGISALRKTWEKIAYYTGKVEIEKEATDEKGNLHLPYLIKENLRQYRHMATISGFHPYHYAHQLSLKICECIAIVDGLKPSLDSLARLIWSMQRHLLSWQTLQEAKSPYDEYDQMDKQIVKTVLEITAEEPHLSLNQLEARVTMSFSSLIEIPAFSSQETLLSTIAALIADKLYAASPLHISLLPQEKSALFEFIRTHIELCRKVTPQMHLSDLARRILSLYLLATELPKDLSEEDLRHTIESVYRRPHLAKPTMNEALFAFLSAEIALRGEIPQKQSSEGPIEIIGEMLATFKEALTLPRFPPEDLEIVEIVIWHQVSDKERLLSNLPFRVGQRIEEEIALQLIDTPKQTFSSLVHYTYQSFYKMREVATTKTPKDIARKIHLWCTQGDLLYRCIRFERETPLMRLIAKMAREFSTHNMQREHRASVSQICEMYLREHPTLGCYAGQLFRRIFTLYKYSWFTLLSKQEESSIDRFIAWHAASYDFLSGKSSFTLSMQTLFAEKFPFLPFDPKLCDKFAASP